MLRGDQARHTTRDGRTLLDGLSLELARGEILGLAGVEGNGQAALEEMLTSLIALDTGTVEVDGVEIRTGRPGSMPNVGVTVIPEDRHQAGCVLGMTVAENLVLDDVLDRKRPRLNSRN